MYRLLRLLLVLLLIATFVVLIFRYFYSAQGIQRCFNISESDIIYISLPLYHTSASTLGIGQMITHGCTVALKKKFSASNFWSDCIKYQCTVSYGN